MMKRRLNFIFALSILLLAVGIIWQWRGALTRRETVQIASDIPVLQREEISENIETADQEANNGTMQQFNNETVGAVEAVSVAEPLSIPDRMNLVVPFTSQAPEKNWDQPWQDACEEAAVLMLDAYYKGYGLSPLFAKDELLKMVAWEENEKNWGRSITIEQVKELTEHYMGMKSETRNSKSETNSNTEIQNSNFDIVSNFDIRISNFQVIENPTIGQIKLSVASGNPVLVMAYGKALPNPYFRNGGPEYHALVIRGYTETEFITNDPGTWRGENFVYTYDDLMNAIHDWNGGDVPNGKKVALVLVDSSR